MPYPLIALALAIGAWPVFGAGLNVGAGATVNLGNGRVDLNCLDLVTGGQFVVGAGAVSGANSVNILATGELDSGSGSIQLAEAAE